MNRRKEEEKLTILNNNSTERDLRKKKRLWSSFEEQSVKKNLINTLTTGNKHISNPISSDSSHKNIANVLRTLGGIRKSLGYKIPMETSVKSSKDKKKDIKKMSTNEMHKKSISESRNGQQSELPHDLFRRTTPTNISATTLSQKVAEVLNYVKNKKPLSELNLFQTGTDLLSYKNGNVSMPNFPLVANSNASPPISFNKEDSQRTPVGSKCLSSESLKCSEMIKQPSKSSSYENDRNVQEQHAKPEDADDASRNPSETLVRRVDLTKSPSLQDSRHFQNLATTLLNSFESIEWKKLGLQRPDFTKHFRSSTFSVNSSSASSNQNRVCRHKSQSDADNLNLKSGTPSCFSSLLPSLTSSNSKFCCCGINKENTKNVKQGHDYVADPVKKKRDPSWESEEVSKMNVKVCHCPHLHTENAIKKICFYDCTSPQSLYCSKIFRVNYLSKEERLKEKQISESESNQDEEITIESSNPSIFEFANNSDVSEKEKCSTKGIAKIASEPVNRNLKQSIPSSKTSEFCETIPKSRMHSKKESGDTKTEKKEKLKKTRTLPERVKPNPKLRNKENHVKLLEQSFLHRKRPTSGKKSFEGTRKPFTEGNPKKISPQVKAAACPLIGVQDKDSKNGNHDEKTLEELAVLEKLFAKLKSVERSLRRSKLTNPRSREKYSDKFCSIPKMALKKNKKEESSLGFNEVKSWLTIDSLAEEEFQRRRKKLRIAIIRHVQNWLKLDFDDF